MSDYDNGTRIAVVGLGGVGGYLGAMLSAKLPHVSVVARGARFDAISENGIVLHSDLDGEIRGVPETVVHSAGELAEQDYIFICVKNYSLEEALAEMAPAVGRGTVLVPVMNGVDCGEKVREAFPGRLVIDSVIYTVSMALPDYSIHQQGDFTAMRIGVREAALGGAGTAAADGAGTAALGGAGMAALGGAGTASGGADSAASDGEDAAAKVEELSAILTAAGVRHKISRDIEVDIWRKYILNCAYNVATAAWDCPIGGLRNVPERAADYASLVREAYAVGCAKGVALTQKHCDTIVSKFAEYADDASSSLQRDLHDGKRAELDTFSGYIVSEARRLGLAVPVSEKYYKMLLARVGGTAS